MTIVYMHDDCWLHNTGAHPENKGRLDAVRSRLSEIEPDLAGLRIVEEFEPINSDFLQLCHDQRMPEAVKALDGAGGGSIDPDTIVSPGSWRAAQIAAGAGVAALHAVFSGVDQTATCLIRPPGHHATANKSMGFCLFNNIAVAAKVAQLHHRVGKVLIVDWDVHHGNGTQDIFYEDDSVYFLSMHRFPFYPGSGSKSETGAGRGLGSTLNLPIEMGTPRQAILEAFEKSCDLAFQKAKPDLVLVSAGFDAHEGDPIGSLGLKTEDFSSLTKIVADRAAQYSGGKLVSFLEGGYHPAYLADSVEKHIKALIDGK